MTVSTGCNPNQVDPLRASFAKHLHNLVAKHDLSAEICEEWKVDLRMSVIQIVLSLLHASL